MDMGSFNSSHSDKMTKIWKVKFCKHLEKLQTKKALKFHLDLNFNNLEESKNGRVLG